MHAAPTTLAIEHGLCVNEAMQTDEILTTTSRQQIHGRALARVTHLDARGQAIGDITRWLSSPSQEEWALVHGPDAAATSLPEGCSFVGGLPSELIEVDIAWTTPRPGRKHARRRPPPRVRAVAVHEPSPERVSPVCAIFGECGGCQLQHMSYDHQLQWKSELVAQRLRDAGLDLVAVQPTIGCTDPWHYRNHMRFSVDRDGRSGLTATGSHRVIPLRSCPIADALINTALDTLAHAPMPRPQVLVRCGTATGEVLIQPAAGAELDSQLRSVGLDVRTDMLTERLRVPGMSARQTDSESIPFRIRPSSFFQTNTRQANTLANLIAERMPTGPNMTIVDAYCGVGTFAALLAPHVGRVLAVEESASAVRDARWNLRDIPNVEVIQAKVEAWLPDIATHLDGLVIDPPRAGCAPPVLDALIARRIPRVVYVSCEPATLARDLAYLCRDASAYRVTDVQPLDMFPQTAHVETVATLETA